MAAGVSSGLGLGVLKPTLKCFVKKLYTRPVGDYLKTHKFSNSVVVVENNENKPGLKDNRSLRVEVDDSGKKEDLFFGLLVTELFAYMEMGNHPELCGKGSLDNIYDRELIIKAQDFKSYIDADPETRKIIEQNGGLGMGRAVPDMSSLIGFSSQLKSV